MQYSCPSRKGARFYDLVWPAQSEVWSLGSQSDARRRPAAGNKDSRSAGADKHISLTPFAGVVGQTRLAIGFLPAASIRRRIRVRLPSLPGMSVCLSVCLSLSPATSALYPSLPLSSSLASPLYPPLCSSPTLSLSSPTPLPSLLLLARSSNSPSCSESVWLA